MADATKNVAAGPTPPEATAEAAKNAVRGTRDQQYMRENHQFISVERSKGTLPGEEVAMALLGWVAAVAAIALVALVVYALYLKLEMKFGLKVPFAAIFFEAKGHEGGSAKS
jgi:hypothetical protein